MRRALVALGSIAATALFGSAVAVSLASWTDVTVTAVPVTAGTWASAPTTGACTAYNQNGASVGACTITGVSFHSEWQRDGATVRDYYVTFSAPGATRWIDFSVDLRTAPGTAFAWTKAGVLREGAQFTPAAGWGCAQLPVVRGRTLEWNTQTVYFQVSADRTSTAMLCS